ncbi:MAG: hypothetical protein V4598_01260 [Bdellovibrionota bacterium]
MGLAEKRAISTLTAKQPEWQKQINDVCGFNMALEVKWDTLAVDGYGHIYDQWETVFMTPFMATLKGICADQMGKDALKAKFNKVVFQNISGTSNGDYAIKFDDNVIVLDHSFSNVDYHEERAKAWTQALEKVL